MEIIEKLQSTKNQTIEYFDLPDGELTRRYDLGKWSIRQILHHLADAETVLYDRIKRTISKPHQVLWGFDQDAWAEKLDYINMPLELNKNVYQVTREAIIYQAEQHYQQSGENQFVHSRTGLKSLKDLFDKVARHNQKHLDQIQLALHKEI